MNEQAPIVTKHASLPLGVVVRRTPGVTRWAAWAWRAVAVLPGAALADWRELRREGDGVEYHAATLELELHRAETGAYLHGLHAEMPAVYVVMRRRATGGDADAPPLEVVLVTVSPFEAQDYADSGEEIIDKVAMPEALRDWVARFVAAHHQEEAFVKRRRDRLRVDGQEDGVGDPRIPQMRDVYRRPRTRKERLQ